LNQLLCAATVNGRFREALLRNPARAIAGGYHEHTFCLTPEEEELVVNIQAQQLEDFAMQVHRWISGNGNGNGNGHGKHGNGNGNGKNGNGNGSSHSPFSAGRFVDLYRAPTSTWN
jgi:hypothetical protein